MIREKKFKYVKMIIENALNYKIYINNLGRRENENFLFSKYKIILYIAMYPVHKESLKY